MLSTSSMSYLNCRNTIKGLLCLFVTALILFGTQLKANSSDYQYKILDPKYNPKAEEILEGKTPAITEIKPQEKQKHFDFGLFFAICALVTFPIIIVSITAKNFKKIFDEIPGTEKQEIGNIKIKRGKTPPIQKGTVAARTTTKNATNSIKQSTPILSPESKIPKSAGNSINKYFSSPIKKIPNPMLLNTSVLSLDKGLCLVEYNNKYSLIGYIGDDIFLLNQFNTINGREIRSRLSETTEGKDRYIVRLGNYKALVQVTETNMQLLLEL